MKFCIDQQCERTGILLPSSDFYRKADAADRLSPYCKKCVIRATKDRIRRNKDEEQRFGPIIRKPNLSTRSNFAFSLVYDAIQQGHRTREAIQRHTQLSFDSIGDALTELLFVAKGIVIRHGLFVPVEELIDEKPISNAVPGCLECFFENAERKPNVKAGRSEAA